MILLRIPLSIVVLSD